MPDSNNVVPLRPRVARATCALPQYDDETPAEGDELGRAWSLDVIGGAGGKSLLDACLPTHIANAAAAFIMEQLNAAAVA